MYLHIYNGSPTAGGTDGNQVSEQINTTLSASTSSGSTTITVVNAANFYSGLNININTENATVSTVDYVNNIITLTGALASAHASGETVINSAAESNPITSPSAITAGNETGAITLALRCETGYTTSGNTVITPSGTTASDWALSSDGTTWGTYGASLTISSIITTTNTLFYAKYKAVIGENPSTDKTVNLNVTATISAA